MSTRLGIVVIAGVLLAMQTARAEPTLSPKTRDAVERYAVGRRYTTEQIPDIIKAVERMAQIVKPASLSRCKAPLKLIEGHRQFSATLLVNPICGECDRVVDLLKQFAKSSSGEMPTILAGEVPSSEEASREAVVLLHSLADDSDTRLALLRELLVRQPITVEGVRAIARAYAPAIVERRERGQIQDEPPCDDVGTPLLIYRDRLLQRTASGKVTFDPFRTEESLRLAFDAVDDLQRTNLARAARNEESRTVCDNPILTRALRIISDACTPDFCSEAKLRAIERIDRTNLLESLQDPHLMAVHLFFPRGRSSLTDAYDWAAIKKDQLQTISYLNEPRRTNVYIVGYASGKKDSVPLARNRMFAVYRYLKNQLRVKCRSFKGVSFGENILRLSAADAKLLGITPHDYRKNRTILNQGVHVFIYPCADKL